MNYKLIYDRIITRASLSLRKKKQAIYYENHHITPKCLGGSNNKENLVLLTSKEHYICHLLLTKIYKNTSFEGKMLYAFYMMKNKNKYHMRYAGVNFSLAKEKLYGENGCMKGSNSPWFGKKHSEESKQKMSLKRKDICKTEKERSRLKQMALNRSEEHKNKIIKSNTGKVRSLESRQKMSISHRGLQINERNGMARKCVIGDTVFPSVMEASRATLIDHSVILYRIRSKSNKFLHYQYVENNI